MLSATQDELARPELTVASGPKLAVIFHRVGPYHAARLRAANRVLPTTVVEMSLSDDTYAWKPVSRGDLFERVTLFEQDSRREPARKVQQRVRIALSAADPAVVLVPGWAEAESISAILWCGERQVPAIVMSESTEWDEQRVVHKEWGKKRIVRLCSTALAGGEPHAAYLANLGMPRERIFLGYDAVDNDYFAAKADEVREQWAERRAQHGLPERYFLASARFVEKKNLGRLLQAFARYRELFAEAESGRRRTEAWKLVLLGDGPLKPCLVSQLSTLNFQESVILPGFKQYDELPVYYGLASAFIHASTTEQWGLVVNEAMASGLPVLVSNRCGCAQDLVKEGINGFTFDPFNVEELANLMLRLSHATNDCQDQKSMASIQGSRINLSDIGQASRKIIAEWGPERFATGLHSAVELALRLPRPKVRLLDKVLLRLLLMRS